MQLQEYSWVGILRQYNKYFTGETFCVELLLTTSFHPYCGSSMPPSLSSPDMSSKEEPDFHAKSRVRKVFRVHTNLFCLPCRASVTNQLRQVRRLTKKDPARIYRPRLSQSSLFRLALSWKSHRLSASDRPYPSSNTSITEDLSKILLQQSNDEPNKYFGVVYGTPLYAARRE